MLGLSGFTLLLARVAFHHDTFFFFNIERLHVLNQTKFPRNFVLCEMDLNFTKNTRAVNHFIQLHFDLHVMLRSEQYIFPSLICLSIVLMFNLNLLNCNKFIWLWEEVFHIWIVMIPSLIYINIHTVSKFISLLHL